MPANIMVDCETLGTTAGCVIMSIGAVEFTQYGLGREFYAQINLSTALDAGLTRELATQQWWRAQPFETRVILDDIESDSHSRPLAEVLINFHAWLLESGEDVRVWGNGAGFDQPIIAKAYKQCGWKAPPWRYSNERCYRTLKSLAPHIEIQRIGTHHNAGDDARAQAEHAIRLVKELKVIL
jgi:3' exoribonuclease, RNase T-like